MKRCWNCGATKDLVEATAFGEPVGVMVCADGVGCQDPDPTPLEQWEVTDVPDAAERAHHAWKGNR